MANFPDWDSVVWGVVKAASTKLPDHTGFEIVWAVAYDHIVRQSAETPTLGDVSGRHLAEWADVTILKVEMKGLH